MSRDPRLVLEDIEQSAAKIVRYTAGHTRNEVFDDELRLDAVLMNLRLIGEAVQRLPRAFTEGHPEVAWREIGGARDLVAHAYFSLDPAVVWDAVESAIPQLLEKVGEILNEQEVDAPSPAPPAPA